MRTLLDLLHAPVRRGRPLAWATSVCAALSACSATPDEGALGEARQPLSFTPNLPWPSGMLMYCTQGQNSAFSHTGNLQYALDFAVAGCDGTHVLAVGDGTVTFTYEACSCNDCDCNWGWGNAIVVDHGNGDFSKYTHLQHQSIPVAVGDAVCRGDHLGNIGTTGWSTGYHLHFQFQSGGDINSPSVPFEGFAETSSVPVLDDQLTSQNVEGAGCGTSTGCEVTIDLGTTVVDDQTDCFFRVGQYWWEESYGHDGHHWYTYTIDDAQPDSTARWDANVVAEADYLVEVFVPDNPDALTTGVRYAVEHDGATDEVEVDQSAHRGEWVALGTYHFAVGDGQRVRIFDDTGEPYVDTDGPRLLCDAVRFTSLGDDCADQCDDGELRCEGPGWQECGDYDGDPCLEWGGGDSCETGTRCDAGRCVPDDGADAGTGGGGTGGSAAVGLPGDEEAGCSCRVPAWRSAGSPWLVALAALQLFALARRRRRSSDGR